MTVGVWVGSVRDSDRQTDNDRLIAVECMYEEEEETEDTILRF